MKRTRAPRLDEIGSSKAATPRNILRVLEQSRPRDPLLDWATCMKALGVPETLHGAFRPDVPLLGTAGEYAAANAATLLEVRIIARRIWDAVQRRDQLTLIYDRELSQMQRFAFRMVHEQGYVCWLVRRREGIEDPVTEGEPLWTVPGVIAA